MASRQLERETRLLRDQQKAQTKAAATANTAQTADVSGISPGAARDGRDLVSVTYRGGETTCAGYLESYTPTVGDRVAVLLIDDQLIIAGRIVGAP